MTISHVFVRFVVIPWSHGGSQEGFGGAAGVRSIFYPRIFYLFIARRISLETFAILGGLTPRNPGRPEPAPEVWTFLMLVEVMSGP
jgi:hypothetical protein